MSSKDTQFKPGVSGNPGGKPKGQRSYSTLRALAIQNLGKKKNMTEEEIEVLMHENGVARAVNGDYRFYRDDLDRTHGTAMQMSKTQIEHTGEVIMENNIDIEEIAKKVAEQLKEKKTNVNTHEGTTSGS